MFRGIADKNNGEFRTPPFSMLKPWDGDGAALGKPNGLVPIVSIDNRVNNPVFRGGHPSSVTANRVKRRSKSTAIARVQKNARKPLNRSLKTSPQVVKLAQPVKRKVLEEGADKIFGIKKKVAYIIGGAIASIVMVVVFFKFINKKKGKR